MKITSRINRLILLIILSMASCVSYTNRVSYECFNIPSTLTTISDTVKPIVIFRLQKELTSHIGAVPVFWVQGEKGHFRLSIHIYGEASKKYRGFVLKNINMYSDSKLIYSSNDSLLVSMNSKSKVGYLYYTSDYIVDINENLPNPSLYAEYILIRNSSFREKDIIESKVYINKKKGLYGY